MFDIGKLLKEKRQLMKYSINDISDILKIRPKYIKAIENNIEADLPNNVYTKGYVKNYAKFLDIKDINFEDIYEHKNENNNLFHRPEYINKIPENNIVFVSLFLIIMSYFSFNQKENIFEVRNSHNFVDSKAKNFKKNIFEINQSGKSTLKKFKNNEELAFMATTECSLKIFDNRGKLFEDKKLSEGDIYFVSNKLDLTIAVSHKDNIEIFNNKDLNI